MENYVYEGQAYDENYDLDVFTTTQSRQAASREKKSFGFKVTGILSRNPHILWAGFLASAMSQETKMDVPARRTSNIDD